MEKISRSGCNGIIPYLYIYYFVEEISCSGCDNIIPYLYIYYFMGKIFHPKYFFISPYL
jgi:hypothetical protein